MFLSTVVGVSGNENDLRQVTVRRELWLLSCRSSPWDETTEVTSVAHVA